MEVERLLNPIFDDTPTGENLRLAAGDTTISDIEEMRREEDPALDVAGKGKSADWDGVVRACEAALSRKSKDLQLAAHLTEALAYTEGFGGVLDGLKLVRGMMDRFWDQLHPGWEDGELIEPVRARWLSWMGSSRDFQNAIKRIPIAMGPGVTPRPWQDYESSQRVDEASVHADQTAHTELVEQGLISGEDWRTALAATATDRLERICVTMRECIQEIEALNALCDNKFQEDAPNLIETRSLFEEIVEYLDSRAASSAAGSAATSEAAEGASVVSSGPAPAGVASGPASSGPIKSRDEAYRRLTEVADFLRRTEPHSPVAALVDRAVRWGNLSFEDLLRDVLKSKDARRSVLEVLGIQEKG